MPSLFNKNAKLIILIVQLSPELSRKCLNPSCLAVVGEAFCITNAIAQDDSNALQACLPDGSRSDMSSFRTGYPRPFQKVERLTFGVKSVLQVHRLSPHPSLGRILKKVEALQQEVRQLNR